MTATMERPKAKPAARVSDDPRVRGEQDKVNGLRSQVTAASAEAERLRKLASQNPQAAAALAVANGTAPDAAMESASRLESLATAERRIEVLKGGLAIAEGRLRDACRVVAAEILASEKTALTERLLRVAQSVRVTLQDVADVGELLQDLAGRGVTVEPSHWRGVLTNPNTVAMFHLPNPGAAADVYAKYHEHLSRHFPAVARDLDSALES